MSYTIFKEAPPVILEFLNYIGNVKGRSDLTVDEYYRDLRTFFRFLIKDRGLVKDDIPVDDIDISSVDLAMIESVTFSEIILFLNYCKDERNNTAATRARKTSSLKDFFNYLTIKVHKLSHNPTEELEAPKKGKRLPKYLTLEESLNLLKAVDGEFKERDYCILIFFLNCGLRLSELVGINLSDINSEYTLKIRGKGNKERMLTLNPACVNALKEYLKVRPTNAITDKNALFISRKRCRMTNKGVYHMVNHYLEKIGLGNQGYSPHKLRHTAATLMYQKGGVDIRTLQAILGHSNLGTTQIYTHIADEQIEKGLNANPLANI
ncbi:MAG: tyrosine recombinase XerC [Clostridia bacterium]|nr:tyrosine recombinase XerC [Clostridia bacterium]MBR2177173.1 tyrosine recombinase XerC [Clostridia bacterium]